MSKENHDKVYYVISHTHWDREWYRPFQQFRMQLVDLIDRLLGILEEYPEYMFHLDAQTVVLEDYLEIRPQNRELLHRYIAAGNILVGPWYLQNDFYLTSGEATVRNLLEGTRLAAEFGACGDVGYAPDQFGNISQLPQILADFGIDNFVFGRGYSLFRRDENGEMVTLPTPSEFIWQGADGTRALAIHMKHWYNNAQRFSADPERAVRLTELIENSFEGVAATPYLLLMNGVDHLEPQEDLLPILEQLNTQDIHGTIRQTTLSQYVRDVQKYVEEHQVPLTVHEGELRDGHDYSILQGTLSSRAYLKRLNVLAQNTLEQRLEPLYTILETAGCRSIYPADYMRFLWKRLMQNHPHDSICGCSRDEVHAHMEDRYQSIREVTDMLMRRALQTAAEHSDAGVTEEDYSLVAVNTLSVPQSGVIEAELLFPEKDGVTDFTLYDAAGRPVPYDIISREMISTCVFSPINLPGVMQVERCRIYLYVPDTAAFSLRGYRIVKGGRCPAPMTPVQDTVPVLENAFLRLEIREGGHIDLLDKQSGRLMRDCLYLQDTGDRGESYVCIPTEDAASDTRTLCPRVTVTQKNGYVQACRLEWDWQVPADYDFANQCRTPETVVMKTALELTLKKGDATLDVGYTVDNTARSHRVRLIVATDLVSDHLLSDIPFDVVSHTDGWDHPGIASPDRPNTSFLALEQDGKGVAVFTEGTHECRKVGDGEVAVTLLRATGSINGTPVSVSDQWLCPGNQCLRRMEGRIGVRFYEGDVASARLPVLAQRFRNPLLVGFAAGDRRKFSGGRPAVQDSAVGELFYRPDPYAGAVLRDNVSAVSVEGPATVTAFKKAEDGIGYILRLFHYGTAPDMLTIIWPGEILRSTMAERDSERLGTGRAAVSVRGKQILTLRLLP